MATGPTDHDDLRDHVGVFVLGALTAPERAAFEAHLATCAECAAEVRSLMPVAGALAQLVPQTDPPVMLRARMLALIGPGRGGSAGAPSLRASPEPAPWARGWAAWFATAASLALAIALGAYAVALRGRIASLEVRLREAALRADQSERLIADTTRTAAEARLQVAVLAAPDLARVDLAGQTIAPRAAARAFWSRSRGLIFTASNIPTLPTGRTYQLWVLSKQAPPYGADLLLKPDADGRVTVVFSTPTDLPTPIGMAVTIEPEGGVPAPTGDMYLVGKAL